MKKLIAIAVLATTTSVAFAADRAIYDVQYLPNAGTTYGQTEWQWNKLEVEPKGTSAKVETAGWLLQQTVGHSFTDRLSVEGTINYANLTTEVSGAGTNVPDTDQTGISDPTVQARFRTMDEQYRWDIIGGATIGLGDSEVESDGDRDNLQGGSSVFLGTQFGQRIENMQWAVLGQYTHNMEATTEDKTGGTTDKIDDESHGTWTLRADLLNKLAEKSFLRSHITGTWAPKYDSEMGGVKDSNASVAAWDIGTQYQHLFSQDLLAFGGVDYLRVSTDTGDIDSIDGWRFTLGARYQF